MQLYYILYVIINNYMTIVITKHNIVFLNANII